MLTFVFLTWSRGLKSLVRELVKHATPLASLLRSTAKVPRVPGLAVYFTRDPNGALAALLHSRKPYHVLHEHVLLLTIETSLLPKVGEAERLKFEPMGSGFGRAVLTFGYMDEPNLPAALNALPEGWRISPMLITYVLGRQILLIPPAHRGLPLLQDKLFLLMMRLAGSAIEYYDLPPAGSSNSADKSNCKLYRHPLKEERRDVLQTMFDRVRTMGKWARLATLPPRRITALDGQLPGCVTPGFRIGRHRRSLGWLRCPSELP